MWWTLTRAAIAAFVVVAVSEIAQRYPRVAALLLTLPLVSILAFLFTWQQGHNLPAISRLAKETLVLVPLGLPFFVPLVFAERLGLSFWTAFLTGIALAAVTIGVWLYFGPCRF